MKFAVLVFGMPCLLLAALFIALFALARGAASEESERAAVSGRDGAGPAIAVPLHPTE